MNARKTLLILVAIASVFIWNNARTNSAQPPAGHTGAPGQPTCATAGCHGGTPNFNPSILKIGTVPFTALNNGYNPGQEYNITVTNEQSSAVYGFSLSVVDENGNQAGNISLSNPNLTSLSASGGIQYVGHLSASGSNAWTFKWEAPSSDVGPVTFYAASNASNGDGTVSGSNIFTSSKTVTTSGIVNSVFEVKNSLNGVEVYPNPATEFIRFTFDAPESGTLQYQLFDLSGKVVQQSVEEIYRNTFVEREIHLNNDIPAGLYMLKLKLNDKYASHKVVVR